MSFKVLSIRMNLLKEKKWNEWKNFTGLPSGKQRQKKSGRGRPTPSLIASVITAVISTEYKIPVQIYSSALTDKQKLPPDKQQLLRMTNTQYAMV